MYRRLLVPLDGSPFAEAALAPATVIARSSQGDIDFMLVHEFSVATPHGIELLEQSQRAEEDAYRLRVMEPLVEELGRSGIHAEIVLRHGRAADAIIAHTEEHAVDLVVMASHGRTGIERVVLGSVADQVMHHSTCPVLVVRPGDSTSTVPPVGKPVFGRIMVPLDGSMEAEAALEDAAALAGPDGATVLLVRVVTPIPSPAMNVVMPEVMVGDIRDETATQLALAEARDYLASLARDVRLGGVTTVETHVLLATEAGFALADFAQSHGVALVAMTTHGRGASRLIIGSVADRLLKGTACAVLMHRRPRVTTAAPMREMEEVREVLILEQGLQQFS